VTLKSKDDRPNAPVRWSDLARWKKIVTVCIPIASLIAGTALRIGYQHLQGVEDRIGSLETRANENDKRDALSIQDRSALHLEVGNLHTDMTGRFDDLKRDVQTLTSAIVTRNARGGDAPALRRPPETLVTIPRDTYGPPAPADRTP
jgi:hypothetical protein